MFEKALFESTHRTAPRGRLLLLAVAVLAHLLALGALTAVQALAVEPVEEPTILIACELGGYLDAPEPLPPPPRTTVPRGSAPAVQPTAIPGRLPPSETGPIPSETDNSGVDESLDVGQPKSTRAVKVAETPAPTPAPETEDPPRVYRVGGAVTAPVLVVRVDPVYPAAARAVRKHGDVRVRAVIRTDGTVDSVARLEDGVGFGAFDAIRDAVLLWRYEPARAGGRAVPVWIDITVSFRLT
ncbi:MAG: TonB family protein [Acidobacteria bacterium]|nr:TonB family protein [Acidobacteriota bacterium]